MSQLFSLRTGHKGDQFFTTKDNYIVRVWYNRDKCLDDIQQSNTKAKKFQSKLGNKGE